MERFSMKDERIPERQEWAGYLTVKNMEAVATRLKQMLAGKRYTWVALNEMRGQWQIPEVRTSQQLSPESSRDGQPLYTHYGNDGTWGFISIVDSYGVWSCNADSGERAAYLHITPNKLTVEQYAPAGHRLIWVIAIEQMGSDD